MLLFAQTITNSFEAHQCLHIFLKKGNLYLGPLFIIDRILESEIIFKSQWLYDQRVDSNIYSPDNLKSQE